MSAILSLPHCVKVLVKQKCFSGAGDIAGIAIGPVALLLVLVGLAIFGARRGCEWYRERHNPNLATNEDPPAIANGNAPNGFARDVEAPAEPNTGLYEWKRLVRKILYPINRLKPVVKRQRTQLSLAQVMAWRLNGAQALPEEWHYCIRLSEFLPQFPKLMKSVDTFLFKPSEITYDEINTPLTDIYLDLFNEIYSGLISSCNYHDEDSFNCAKSIKYNQSFSLCNLNISNIKQNLQKFSETWLTNVIADLYDLDGYTLVEMHGTGGGGVEILADMNVFPCDGLCCIGEICEIIFIETVKGAFGFDKKLMISMLYHPPGCDINLFNEKMKEIWEPFNVNDTDCYIMGNYNINLNYDSHIYTSDFVDLMHSSAFLLFINRPTRVTGRTTTRIDNTYKIHQNTNYCIGILFTDVSDHFPIFCVYKLSQAEKHKEIYILQRIFPGRNRLLFYMALSEIERVSLRCENDAQHSFGMFPSTHINLYAKYFPKRQIKIKQYNRKPRLTDALCDCIRTKKKLYKMSIRTKTAYNRTKYWIYKKWIKSKNALLHTERKFCSDKLEEN